MPIPARSIPTRTGAKSLSTGTFMELDTHGQEAALLAPTLIREDRTQREKCCVSFSSIRSHSSQVRVSPFVALFGSPPAAVNFRFRGENAELVNSMIGREYGATACLRNMRSCNYSSHYHPDEL